MWPMMWTLSPAFSASWSCFTNQNSWLPGSVLLISSQLDRKKEKKKEKKHTQDIPWTPRYRLKDKHDSQILIVAVICLERNHSKFGREILWCLHTIEPSSASNIHANHIMTNNTIAAKCITVLSYSYLKIVSLALSHSDAGSLERLPQSFIVGSSNQSRLWLPLINDGGKLLTGTLSWLPNVGKTTFPWRYLLKRLTNCCKLLIWKW